MAGRLFVVSAPSGAGKTTLCRRLLDTTSGLVYSVSHTTRPPRPGEVDGRDYCFVDQARFKEMIDQGAFLEWAPVFSHHYGTSRAWVERCLTESLDVLADVDVAGAKQIKAAFPQAVLIFIVTPTLAELGRRLRNRRTETEDQLKIRLDRARREIEAKEIYDFLIVNDLIDRAVGDLAAVVQAERLRLDQARDFWPRFFAEV